MTKEDTAQVLKFVAHLLEGPDGQIDEKMKKILRDLEGKTLEEIKTEIHKALDFGAHYAWASDFTMMVGS